MNDELRAIALQLLGGGAARQAGEIVNAPTRAGAMQGQEQAALGGLQPPPQAVTPLGGPAGQPGLGGPVQQYAPQNVPKANGGQMTPAQAKKLAEMLRNR